MAARSKRVKLELFLLSGHSGQTVTDYSKCLEAICGIPAPKRFAANKWGKHIGFPIFEQRAKDRFFFTACEGEDGIYPILHNKVTARSRITPLPKETLLASLTHGAIDLSTRETVIEYNQKGAKVDEIATVLSNMASSAYVADTILQLLPIVNGSFMEKVLTYQVINSASLKIARPNTDWTADYKSPVMRMAEESRGDAIEITVTARTSESKSVSKTAGLLGFLSFLLSKERSTVQAARIEGRKKGDDVDTRISLSKHIEFVRPRILVNNGQLDEMEIFRNINEYLNSRRTAKKIKG